MKKRLLITDLDNTLYDWVTFFALAFEAMSDGLVEILGVPREQLLDEFRAVHQSLGSSEHPFAVFELPSVKARYPDASPSELARHLDEPLHRFNSVRKRALQLYPGVADTLAALAAADVILVGHTEASMANAYFRLDKLGIAQLYRHLYVLEGPPVRHPDPLRLSALAPPASLVRTIPKAERKPNPALLGDICSRENVSPEEAVYVGDSLSRDVFMAKSAGVFAVWARYGTKYDPARWATLVRVTHWTDEDVAREGQIRESARGIAPDLSIDAFADVLAVFGLA